MMNRSYVRYKASYPALPAESRIRIPVNMLASALNDLQKGDPMLRAVRDPAMVPRSHLHLTSRGRAVFSVAGAVVISAAMAAVILGGATATASGENSSTTFEYIQVEAGQSLWQLAETVAPDADPRDVVYEIVKLNQLVTAEVQPGQQIALPLRYSN